MSRTGDARAAERGFTLIEIIVVLAILGLVTALALPRLTGAQAKADTHAAAREVAAALRTTRNLAMTHGRAEAFVIDTANGAFRAGSTARAGHLPHGVRLALVTTKQDRIDPKTGRIRFFQDGSSTGGGVELRKGRSHETVLVDWLTGRVAIGEASHAATR